MTALVQTIDFRTRKRQQVERRARREEGLRRTEPARIARLLALAHDLDARIQAGEYQDYADIARQHGFTRARLTQIMNLLLLAPDIQAEILALQAEPGREPVTERELRVVVATPIWVEQRERWAGVPRHTTGYRSKAAVRRPSSGGLDISPGPR